VTTTISINGSGFYPAEVSLETDVQHVMDDRATKPDPAWEHTDSNGHFHAFAAGGKTPTLATYMVHVDYDGSCGGVCEGEGYDETHWKCVICGEEAHPRFVPDEETRTVGVPIMSRRWWAIKVHGDGPVPGQERLDGTVTLNPTPTRATLRVRTEDQELVGLGYLGPMSMTYSRASGPRWELEITGTALLPRLGAMQQV
jgi:hypothetical protein